MPHRHFTFSIAKMLRRYFLYDRNRPLVIFWDSTPTFTFCVRMVASMGTRCSRFITSIVTWSMLKWGDFKFRPDSTGTKSEREALANQRAEAVRNLFLLAGVSPVVVTPSGNANSKYLDGRGEVVVHPLIAG